MRRTLLALVGILLIGLGVSSAQIVSPLAFTIDNPFYVGNKMLPAGTYTISHATNAINLLVLRGLGVKDAAYATTIAKDNRTIPNSSWVRFNKYGDKLFLESVVLQYQNTQAFAPESSLEKHEQEVFGPAATVVVPASPARSRT